MTSHLSCVVLLFPPAASDMSLYRYFTPCSKRYLPNLEEEKTISEASETKVINEEVQTTLGSCNRKHKSTNNCFYDNVC